MSDSKTPSEITPDDIVKVMAKLRGLHELGIVSFSVLCAFHDEQLKTVFEIADALRIPRASARTQIQSLLTLGLLQRINRGVYKLSGEGRKLIDRNLR